MAERKHNTDRQGKAWSDEMKKKVWQKAEVIYPKSSDQFRNDKCGQIIEFSKHGDRTSTRGWEIDHIIPVSKGGGDDLNNLQPLYWGNNEDKGDSLNWDCSK